MNICHAAKGWIRVACLLAGVPFLIPPVHGADANPPKVFGGAQIQEIYRIRLDRGDLLLESIIAAIEPRLHITLSTGKRGAFGGHLENGCRVLYRVELTIAKLSGTPLARKPNKDGTPALQLK